MTASENRNHAVRTEKGECAALQHHHLFGMERRDLYCANQVVAAKEKEAVDVKGEDVYIG
jgi:hypothetical protein